MATPDPTMRDEQPDEAVPMAPGIAIVGMSGRFPGAASVEEFWSNLKHGVDSVSLFGRDELEVAKATAAEPGYIGARSILKDVDKFDAEFFGIYPREAETMDPQHRIFLECAWEALENSGYAPEHFPGLIGVFAGCSMNTYFMHNLVRDRDFLARFAEGYQSASYTTMLGNDKDFLPTRVSYKLNLRGPSLSIQTACSTSLVAIAQACQSLLTYGCDMALAGAVSITFPQKRGYLPEEGGILSTDGKIRPFDKLAQGTVFGHGAGVVVLKRIEDALADGDTVLAVIRGFAVNNDGSSKAGYTAPSVSGQAEVIAAAQAMAGFAPETITYVEAHGTGTPLGDPVEVSGLTRAFASGTDKREFCVLGTAKASVGHLDVASGVVGLIKTVLQMQHHEIPKLLHFESPNPDIDFPATPFRIPSTSIPWTSSGNIPLRAGVSAFGVGGTNAHLVVEESPAPVREDAADLAAEGPAQVMVLSAKSSTALAAMANNLADYLAEHVTSGTDLSLQDVASTLQRGRNRFSVRRAFAAVDFESSIAALRGMAGSNNAVSANPASANPASAKPASAKPVDRASGKAVAPGRIVFLFPGQGAQSVGMGRRLFEQQPVFRRAMEEADALVRPQLRDGLISAIYPAQSDQAATHLNRTEIAQPAIFAVSYALARLWQSIGMEPELLIGHSIGEFVAATLAGTLTFADALRLVATRGALMQALPAGAMLAVRTSAEVILPYLLPYQHSESPAGILDLASINAPRAVAVAGGFREIEELAARLSADGIASRKLATSHAFHSRMMEPVMADFRTQLAATTFHPPQLPWISTLTGMSIDPASVMTPDYWVEQLRSPVQFSRAVREAVATRDTSSGPMIFLEAGPGHTLSNLVRQNLAGADRASVEAVAIATLPSATEESAAPGAPRSAPFEDAIAQLWEQGVEPDWAAVHLQAATRRVPLPTYPFERKSFWVAPPVESESSPATLDHNPSRLAISAAGAPDSAIPPGQTYPNFTTFPEAKTMPVAPASAVSTTDILKSDLKALVTELSDLDLSQTPSSASFLELGLDSLFLTQLTQSIRGKYNVKLTFRQIMGDYSTFDTLAEHIAAVAPKTKLPAAVVTAATPPQAASVAVPMPSFALPASVAAGAVSSDGYAALFAQQMAAMSALMQQQLAVLQGGGMTTPAAPAALATLPSPASLPAPGHTASAPASSAPAAPEKELGTLMPLRPLDLRAGDTLTPKQQLYMTSLIERYNKKTAKSKASAQHYRDVLADPRVASGFNPQFKEVVYPLAVERSAGAYLWDLDGNKYIDILNGYGSIFFGHSPQFVTDAVRHQLDLGFPIGPQTELAGECAELITKLVGMERATFCNTGSEAVMAAMRLARTVTGRQLIVLFAGAYHGQIDEVLVKSNRSEKSIPTAPGIPGESVANMLVLEYGSPHALEVIRRRADEIAAVLVEPIQSRHPELRPKEFLQEIRTITEEAGAALIFDEVVTGFRTHLGGAQQVYGIRADLATYGKVVAGGMPVGVVAGSRTYMDALDGGAWQFGDASVPQVGVTFFAGTFVRHPLTMAAVKATLEHLRDAGTALQDSLAVKTTSLIGDLNAMFVEFGFPSKIQHFASWFFFSVPPEARLAKLLYYHLRECGLHLQEGFPCFLTTAHTDADLAEVRATFRHVLEEMRAHEIIGHVETTPDPSHSVTTSHIASEMKTGEMKTGEAPITEAQREVLLASQLGAESSCAFNESVSLYLDGPVDVAALEGAIQQVVARHEALRLSVAENGESVIVHPAVSAGLQHEDWRTLDADAQQAELASLLHQEAATPFDLKQAPLFRATLVRLSDKAGDEKSVLVFTGHHIIVDGWSINVLFDEVGKLYTSARTKQPAKLLPVHSFLDQARTEHAEPNAATEAFWLEQFRTLPPPLELPLDRPRGALRDHAGSTLKRTFSKDLVTRLRAASAQSSNTLFTTLLSSYFVLLSRLTQQQDLVVGIPMAGQRNFSGESFVGHSVNFLPIRALLSEATTFADLTDAVKNSVYDALDNQEYTLGTLVRKLKVPRNPARLELVEAQFNLEQVGTGIEFEGLKTRLEANPKAAVNADIFFNFVDRGAEIALEVDYNTGLFDADTIDRWISSLETLLGESAAHARTPVNQLRWLDEAAEQKILVEWNRTESEYPSHLPVHAIFEQQVLKTPDAVALRQAESRLTYAELNALANRFARLLQSEHGGGKTIRVALSLDRSPEMIAAILGVLKAGGVYIPVDPTYPAARLAVLLEDSQPTLLVTQQSLLGNFETGGLRTLTIEDAGTRLDGYSAENLNGPVSSEDPAYIMYTSGSTGNPKGVIVPHRAICRLVLGSDFIHFGPDEIFLQLAPVSFDASTLEIWGALLHGAQLALITGNKPSPEEIGEAIAAYGVTTMWLTAALFHLMVMDYLPLLKPLKQLLAGGDVLSVSHVRKALEAMPSLRLVNGYGPTEGTTFTCCHTITLASLDGDTVPIGRPVSNTRVYILDSQGAPVPAGVPGQLHAAGDGLALGYWRAPELTAVKFIELDLGPAGKERLYRTGDTARYRADGIILFQGRTDNQVKIRGFRVELGEIEAAAERVPGVRAAIVSARPDWSGPEDIPGDKRLALYFLAAESADAETVKQELRAYLQSQLPDHMQPAAILAIDAFPRTANGKVDYRALPAPKAEQRMHTRLVAEPRTPTEGQLASIWCKVLQLDAVSIHDSIFELGGDSLSIFRITTQANQAGIRMTAKHLFQYKTIAAVSQELGENSDAAQQSVPMRATIKPVSRDRFRKTQTLTNVE